MQMGSDVDYVVVGCGFCGSVIARRLAEEQSAKVLILDRRNHIAGNMYDEYDSDGILVQKYGVHVFHTDKDNIFEYLSRFTEWDHYELTCLAEIQQKYVPVPFNYAAIDTFFPDRSEELKTRLKQKYPDDERVPILELINSDDELVREFALFLFENDYKPYTCKQWGRKPEEIEPSILSRVKVALSYDDRYFTNKYQFTPRDGFTEMFKRMLNHPNIELRLETDFKDMISFDGDRVVVDGVNPDAKIVYTGALDDLFDYQYGQLPYRTIGFEFFTEHVDYYLNAPFVAYPMHPTMTRMTEFKSITGQKKAGTTVVLKEFPGEYDHTVKDSEPFYPILSEANQQIYEKYKQLSGKYSNLTICGRLADYKYYDMDNAASRAFEVYKELVKK
ncbi:UDP-galactopyranose mutase [Thermoplasmatales archaeon BRNA1]|nr:UDP-galactopyranose mutase [Thermoplasmatales archaeon BRNA1]